MLRGKTWGLKRERSKGRWPEKSVKFVLRLLKNAESNADAKNLELEDLYIKNIVVQQAPVCSSFSLHKSFIPRLRSRCSTTENSPPHIPCTRSH